MTWSPPSKVGVGPVLRARVWRAHIPPDYKNANTDGERLQVTSTRALGERPGLY